MSKTKQKIKCNWCDKPATIKDYRTIDDTTGSIPSCKKCFNLDTDYLLERMKLKEKVKEYCQLEKEIWDEIGKKENSSGECDCEDREIIKLIHEGGFDEIESWCINCGGYVE